MTKEGVRQQHPRAFGQEIRGKREGGAVIEGGKEEGANRGKRSAKNAGGQAWINNISMGW
jgi:hypothetical protein